MQLSRRSLIRIVPALIVLVVVGLQLWVRPSSNGPPSAAPIAPAGPGTANAALQAAALAHTSGIEVDANGRVTRLLPDDNEGARHQRFIVRVADNLTILVAHNQDLAPRVPVRQGDSVAVRGEYVWNDRGGLIHWTHHDPAHRHQPGWIEYRGRRYE